MRRRGDDDFELEQSMQWQKRWVGGMVGQGWCCAFALAKWLLTNLLPTTGISKTTPPKRSAAGIELQDRRLDSRSS